VLVLVVFGSILLVVCRRIGIGVGIAIVAIAVAIAIVAVAMDLVFLGLPGGQCQDLGTVQGRDDFRGLGQHGLEFLELGQRRGIQIAHHDGWLAGWLAGYCYCYGYCWTGSLVPLLVRWLDCFVVCRLLIIILCGLGLVRLRYNQY
jgi:hypothetical protein